MNFITLQRTTVSKILLHLTAGLFNPLDYTVLTRKGITLTLAVS